MPLDMRHSPSLGIRGAQFIDQVSARHVSIVIGIRPDLVKSLISAELDSTRARLRVRRRKAISVWLVAYQPSTPR